MNRLTLVLLVSLALLASEPVRKGVQTPGVQRSIASLHPSATFAVAGAPDWMAVTETGVWVSSEPNNHVVFLDARANKTGAVATARSWPMTRTSSATV